MPIAGRNSHLSALNSHNGGIIYPLLRVSICYMPLPINTIVKKYLRTDLCLKKKQY